MSKRIHILGPSGSGTSTLGQALAEALGCKWLDTDDYFWRKTEVPFSEKEEPAVRLANIRGDIADEANWVLSGSLCGWGDSLIETFTHTIFLYVPWNVRKARLIAREIERYGEAALGEGGEMHQIHQDFIAWASRYDSAGMEQRSRVTHEAWLNDLPPHIQRISLEGEYTADELAAKALRTL